MDIRGWKILTTRTDVRPTKGHTDMENIYEIRMTDTERDLMTNALLLFIKHTKETRDALRFIDPHTADIKTMAAMTNAQNLLTKMTTYGAYPIIKEYAVFIRDEDEDGVLVESQIFKSKTDAVAYATEKIRERYGLSDTDPIVPTDYKYIIHIDMEDDEQPLTMRDEEQQYTVQVHRLNNE